MRKKVLDSWGSYALYPTAECTTVGLSSPVTIFFASPDVTREGQHTYSTAVQVKSHVTAHIHSSKKVNPQTTCLLGSDAIESRQILFAIPTDTPIGCLCQALLPLPCLSRVPNGTDTCTAVVPYLYFLRGCPAVSCYTGRQGSTGALAARQTLHAPHQHFVG